MAPRSAGPHLAFHVLEQLGSVASMEEGDAEGEYLICGQCCPLAELVAEHPEVCVMVQAMLTDVVGCRSDSGAKRERRPAADSPSRARRTRDDVATYARP